MLIQIEKPHREWGLSVTTKENFNANIRRPQRRHFISFIESRKHELLAYRFSNYRFIRERKLGLVHTLGHVIHMTCSGNASGYEITSQDYFAELGSAISGVARSSLSEAREKLSWEAFKYLLDEVNALPHARRWKGHRVLAADGTCLSLPHTKQIIERFPLDTNEKCRGHYPKGLLLTVADVLTGVPLLAELGHYRTDSERGMLSRNLKDIPSNSILLLDRGYDGVHFFKKIADANLRFIARVRTRDHNQCSITIQHFLRSGKKSQVVWLTNEKGVRLNVRLLRFDHDAEGLPIVLATNLLDRGKYSCRELWECYKKRWNIETLYYRTKRLLHLENFHSRSVNGVKQEIWANLFTLGLTATLVHQAALEAKMKIEHAAPNFKNAVHVMRRHLAVILLARSRKVQQAELHLMFDEILRLTCRKQPGRKNPRIARRSQTSWRRPDGKNRARVQAEKKRAKAAA